VPVGRASRHTKAVLREKYLVRLLEDAEKKQ
jgi:hypothetical protein